jgi:metallophosphoesterase superfamily enzyme
MLVSIPTAREKANSKTRGEAFSFFRLSSRREISIVSGNHDTDCMNREIGC